MAPRRVRAKCGIMRKKILIVDDDAEVVELLRFNFKKAGFAVGTAANGVDALKKACSLSPDLILLDLMLPELDGFAVCEILRRDPATSSIPVLMLTAVASEFARLTGLDAGANGFLTKPFSLKQLVSRVQQLVGEASGHRDEANAPQTVTRP
jgi:DNA-binding response OmpR family regulator